MSMHYHLIGIGGVGMSALAKILLQRGEKVSGSDIYETYVTAMLEKEGAKIFYTQSRSNILPGYTVVYSTAIKQSNPELLQAKKFRCKLLHRSDLLKKLLEEKKSILVAGCHGKTTTAALLSHVLTVADQNPSYVIGGFSPSLGYNGENGLGRWFIAEGDESDGSFLKADPFGAIVTNVSFDHIDYWKSQELFKQAFYDFCQKVEDPNYLVWCKDDEILSGWQLAGTSYGFSDGADVKISNFHQEGSLSYFTLTWEEKTYSDICLAQVGEHNALNAASVFAMAKQMQVAEEEIFKAFASFQGVARRMQLKGEKGGISIYDDYAHHPEEVKRTLLALKNLAKDRRKIAIFQPHRFTRMKYFCKDFAEALIDTDVLILTDVYSAGEDPIEGFGIQNLLEKIEKGKEVHYIAKPKLNEFLANFVKPNDVVITLGAGDITHVGGELLKSL